MPAIFRLRKHTDYTTLSVCNLRMPYDWFYHDTAQNGRSRDKCVLAHIVRNKVCV